MSKFLRYQWCKPPQRDNKNASYLLQVQCLHIANTYLTSASEKNDKDLLKITSMGVLDFFFLVLWAAYSKILCVNWISLFLTLWCLGGLRSASDINFTLHLYFFYWYSTFKLTSTRDVLVIASSTMNFISLLWPWKAPWECC